VVRINVRMGWAGEIRLKAVKKERAGAKLSAGIKIV
jgi:hypothetical protein